jgi:hypothetical protein
MKMNAIYPLFDINTNIDIPIIIESGIYVLTSEIDIEKVVPINLSEEDRHHLQAAQFCLSIDNNMYKPEQVSIAFIISCRLLKRTRVFIRYRIDDMMRVSKIRDDYPFVTSDDVTSTINKLEFGTVSKIFSGLNSFKAISTRTSNALYFIGLAYRSRKWLESLIFHVCALETLTSSSERENRITDKFINRIHNFIGYDKEELRRIYNIRSELVHGRYKSDSKEETLVLLRIAEEVCRKVFIKILLDKSNLDSFNNDENRIKLFERG